LRREWLRRKAVEEEEEMVLNSVRGEG